MTYEQGWRDAIDAAAKVLLLTMVHGEDCEPTNDDEHHWCECGIDDAVERIRELALTPPDSSRLTHAPSEPKPTCPTCEGVGLVAVDGPAGVPHTVPCPRCEPKPSGATVHLRKGSTSDPGNFAACGASDGVVTISAAEVTCPSCRVARGGGG